MSDLTKFECAARKALVTREEWIAAAQNIWDAIIPDQKPLNPTYERDYVEGLADAIQSLIAQPRRSAMTREEAIAKATDICSYTEEIEGVRRVYSLLESLGWLIPKIADAIMAQHRRGRNDKNY